MQVLIVIHAQKPSVLNFRLRKIDKPDYLMQSPAALKDESSAFTTT